MTLVLDVQASLARLSLSATADKREGSTRRQEKALAESWEEELSSGEDGETETERAGTAAGAAGELPKAPPPTPISPRTPYLPHEGESSLPDDRSPRLSHQVGTARPTPPNARPEKTDAVARRMIAGALGVRPPKKTEEQREYEKAMMEKERKKRSRERESREAAVMETERAKAAIWEDLR